MRARWSGQLVCVSRFPISTQAAIVSAAKTSPATARVRVEVDPIQ
jgi:hypothetical protein